MTRKIRLPLFCSSCELDFTREEEMSEHLSSVHVGPITFSNAFLCCGGCCFRVTLDKLHMMITHCAQVAHPPSQIYTDWRDFLRAEEERLINVVTVGLELVKASQRESSSDSFIFPHGTGSARPNENRLDSVIYEDQGRRGPNRSPLQSQNQMMAVKKRRKRIKNLHKKKLKKDKQESFNSDRANPAVVEQSGDLSPKPNILQSGLPNYSVDKAIKNEDDEENNASSMSHIFLDGVEGCRIENTEDLNTTKEENFEAGDGNVKQCSLCSLKLLRPKDYRSDCLRHVFTHDKSLTYFRCLDCDHEGPDFCGFRRHFKTKTAGNKGCTGRFLDISTPETKKRLVALLKEAFPWLDVDQYYPPGSECRGIKF